MQRSVGERRFGTVAIGHDARSAEQNLSALHGTPFGPFGNSAKSLQEIRFRLVTCPQVSSQMSFGKLESVRCLK